MSDFVPEYEGDNPNRKWVRDKIREKRITTDIIKRLPQPHIDWMFEVIIQNSYYGA